MTHQIYPSNITKLLSAEQYRILTQELVQKVFSSLLVAPPVASPLRAHGAAPSLAAPQRSAEHTDITELQHIILSEYFMIVKKKYYSSPLARFSQNQLPRLGFLFFIL